MTQTGIWGSLPRATNDATLIDQAIEMAVGAHNDDPDAHLGADQALQSHRAAEIIDHLAESVVNDKLAPVSRAYTAIVDPNSEYDYATIEAALAYVVSAGGGRILVRAGDHFISQTISLPKGINIEGEGATITNIHCGVSGGAALLFTDGVRADNANTTISDLSLVRTDGTIFDCTNLSNATGSKTILRDSSLEGGGCYSSNSSTALALDNCIVDINTVAAFAGTGLTARTTDFVSTVAGVVCDGGTVASAGFACEFSQCHIDVASGEALKRAVVNSTFDNCTFMLVGTSLPASSQYAVGNRFIACTFVFSNGGNATIGATENIYTVCAFRNNDDDDVHGYVSFTNTSLRNVLSSSYLQHDIKTDSGIFNRYDGNVTKIATLDDPGAWTSPTATNNVKGSGGWTGAGISLVADVDYEHVFRTKSPYNQVEVWTLSGHTYNLTATLNAPSGYDFTFFDYVSLPGCFGAKALSTGVEVVMAYSGGTLSSKGAITSRTNETVYQSASNPARTLLVTVTFNWGSLTSMLKLWSVGSNQSLTLVEAIELPWANPEGGPPSATRLMRTNKALTLVVVAGEGDSEVRAYRVSANGFSSCSSKNLVQDGGVLDVALNNNGLVLTSDGETSTIKSLLYNNAGFSVGGTLTGDNTNNITQLSFSVDQNYGYANSDLYKIVGTTAYLVSTTQTLPIFGQDSTSVNRCGSATTGVFSVDWTH